MVTGEDNRFRIAVQELDSGTVRVLTDSRLDESPSIAPNGSMIIFATERNNRGILEAVSVDGRAHQRLGTSQGDVREPAWSPFIGQ
jgi:TolB protein